MGESRGEAADYYQQGGSNGYGYGAGPQTQQPQQAYGGGQPQYQQQYPPPQNQPYQPKPPYEQNPNNNEAPPPYGYQPPEAVGGGKEYTFDQAFKVDKPKWNDLWAGILVCHDRGAIDAFFLPSPPLPGAGRRYGVSIVD